MLVFNLKQYVRFIYALLLGRASKKIRYLVWFMQHCRLNGSHLMAKICSNMLQKHGIYISSNAQIDSGLKLPHPVAIVIGDGVIIGKNVTLYQSVTLGGRVLGDWSEGNYPSISDGAIIYSGAIIAGKVRVGKNAIVGANSVVISDIPDDSVAVGAPARVIKNTKNTKNTDNAI